VIFLTSAVTEVDNFGSLLLSAIKSQGLPSFSHVVQNLDKAPVKQHDAIKKSLISFMSKHISDEKVISCDTDVESMALLRNLTNSRPKGISWREKYAYLLATDVSQSEQGVEITGSVRGQGLSVNRLVHLQNFGDFKVDKITIRSKSGVDDKEIFPDGEQQEDFACVNELNDMDAEQTWPTEEEMAYGEEMMNQRAQEEIIKKKKVPKGTSSYQSAWIVESEGESDNEESDKESIMGEEDAFEDIEEQHESDKDEDFDMEQDEEEYNEYMQKQEDSKQDLLFPDEVDTPRDFPARTRFQRYYY
jgi:pre-rRNA-processing protein TSR1